MDAAVGHQRNLVINALSDGQPVQRVTKYRSDVLVESRSLVLVVPFDEQHMISYWSSIVTMSIFCTIFEILSVVSQKLEVTWL